MKVFRVSADLERGESVRKAYDISHLPFLGDSQAIYIWAGNVQGTIPLPLICFGDISSLPHELDYPILSLGIPVVSRRILNCFNLIENAEYHVAPIKMYDSSEKEGFDNKNPPKIVCEDFYIFRIDNPIDCFDYDRSVYTNRKSDPSLPSVVNKLVLKEPKNGFPSIFCLSEVVGFFVPEVTKQALEECGVKGIVFSEVEVSRQEFSIVEEKCKVNDSGEIKGVSELKEVLKEVFAKIGIYESEFHFSIMGEVIESKNFYDTSRFRVEFGDANHKWIFPESERSSWHVVERFGSDLDLLLFLLNGAINRKLRRENPHITADEIRLKKGKMYDRIGGKINDRFLGRV